MIHRRKQGRESSLAVPNFNCRVSPSDAFSSCFKKLPTPSSLFRLRLLEFILAQRFPPSMSSLFTTLPLRKANRQTFRGPSGWIRLSCG
ncbi:hypothetical protein AVEN_66213-1 [Araneus ventricosus]|uniref:Uncharacterized protein n=1 Tax=Araneus ventricosus TaxID=182803 RepID=A0A4Y2GZN0_ARAVE|nr:hypothetical protein AVEN_66213-1 [Araneus ventricosus]